MDFDLRDKRVFVTAGPRESAGRLRSPLPKPVRGSMSATSTAVRWTHWPGKAPASLSMCATSRIASDAVNVPASPEDRARVRALAAIVGCDIHPVNNRRILEALRHEFSADDAAVHRWCATWINDGFEAIEALLAADAHRGDFCFGRAPTLADVYLIPQVESARRFKVDMGRWPLIVAVDAACALIDAFRRAAPAMQPDAA